MDKPELINVRKYFGIEYDKDDDYTYLIEQFQEQMEGGK